VEKGKIQHILVGFRTPCGKLTTTCRHDCAIRYMTASRVLTSGILKILNLSEILPVYLVPCLSVAVTYRPQILHILSVSGVIENYLIYLENLPRNLEKFADENCGP